MGCKRLTYHQSESTLKVVYRKTEPQQKVVQRFLSVDPMANKFPHESPYLFSGNNPIYFVDEEGKAKTTYITVIENGKKSTIKLVDKDYVVKKRIYYIPDEGAHVASIDWDYNVVEFVTIDYDNDKVYTTGEILVDKTWDDWLEKVGDWLPKPTKQGTRKGGNPLISSDFADLPGNMSKYLPTAENPGKEIDVSSFFGNRGGAKLTPSRIQMIIDVYKAGLSLGQQTGDAANKAKEFIQEQEQKEKEFKCGNDYCAEPHKTWEAKDTTEAKESGHAGFEPVENTNNNSKNKEYE